MGTVRGCIEFVISDLINSLSNIKETIQCQQLSADISGQLLSTLCNTIVFYQFKHLNRINHFNTCRRIINFWFIFFSNLINFNGFIYL